MRESDEAGSGGVGGDGCGLGCGRLFRPGRGVRERPGRDVRERPGRGVRELPGARREHSQRRSCLTEESAAPAA